MKIYKSLIGITFAAMAISASAHTGLGSSIPANDAMLMESPDAVELNFTADVNLIQFEVLKKMDGSAVEVEFTPSATASSYFSLPVPKLAMGHYQVNWGLLGGDGHKIEGSFEFMVHDSNAMPMAQMGHGQMMDHSAMPMGDGQMIDHSMMSESPTEDSGTEESAGHDH